MREDDGAAERGERPEEAAAAPPGPSYEAGEDDYYGSGAFEEESPGEGAVEFALDGSAPAPAPSEAPEAKAGAERGETPEETAAPAEPEAAPGEEPPNWRDRAAKLPGALPPGLLRWVALATCVTLAPLVYLTTSRQRARQRAPAPSAEEAAAEERAGGAAVPSGRDLDAAERSVSESLEASRRQREEAARREREELEARRAEILESAADRAEALLRDGAGGAASEVRDGARAVAPPALELETEQVQAMRESLRIEELQREARAPRANPLVLDRPAGEAPSAAPAPAAPDRPAPSAADRILAAADDTRTQMERLRAQLLEQELGPAPAPAPPPASAPPATPAAEAPRDPNRLLREGALLPAVLTTSLDSRLPGPANAMISRTVRARDRRTVLIPRGTKMLGRFAAAGQSGRRLGITFHRLIFPDGRDLSLSTLALDRMGRAGFADSVNSHYAQRFAAVGLLGLITALPQALVARSARGTGAGGGVVAQSAMQQAGAQMAGPAQQAVQPMLERQATVKVRAGTEIRIRLESDLEIPPARTGRGD